MSKNGLLECPACGTKVGTTNSVSKAYDHHNTNQATRLRGFSVLLIVLDCLLISLQPILVYMSKVNGKFEFSPVSVNFLTEATKVFFAVCMLIIQARKQRHGEKSLLSPSVILQAGRANYLLAFPAFLYAINNYLKFTMQLYFDPATVKMLSNLKVLMIAVLLKMVMKRKFTLLQWQALALLLIGISVNQLHTTSSGSVVVPIARQAYFYTLFFVTVPSMASVFNELALKAQFDTSVHLQNLFLYGYGAMFNFMAILFQKLVLERGTSLHLLQGHSRATVLLIVNNAAQGILSCFFLKYADAILKKYSSTVATIFTALASAALFGHTLRINFLLGVSIVVISMHQFFNELSKTKDPKDENKTKTGVDDKHKDDDTRVINMATGATNEANLNIGILDDENRHLLGRIPV